MVTIARSACSNCEIASSRYERASESLRQKNRQICNRHGASGNGARELVSRRRKYPISQLHVYFNGASCDHLIRRSNVIRRATCQPFAISAARHRRHRRRALQRRIEITTSCLCSRTRNPRATHPPGPFVSIPRAQLLSV